MMRIVLVRAWNRVQRYFNEVAHFAFGEEQLHTSAGAGMGNSVVFVFVVITQIIV